MYAIRSYYAERTGTSTKEIALVISEVQEESRRAVDTISTAGKSVAEGVQLSQESGVALAKIVEGARVITSYSIHYTKLYDLLAYPSRVPIVDA